MKHLSIVTPCFNEAENVAELYQQVKKIMTSLSGYHYEHLFIDNASTDQTLDILKSLSQQDPNVKIIVNTRNFGHIRSPHYAMLQAQGDAVIMMAADLQDPPEMLLDFIRQWEAGFKMVAGVKPKTQERFPMSVIRRTYYKLIGKIADVQLIKNFTGFGLYDRSVIEIIRQMDDPYPYFRGLISEIGFKVAEVPYHQPIRKHGATKNNLYTLYDLGILGVTNHSKLPIRIATLGGFFLSLLSLVVAFFFFVLKLVLWQHFPIGISPLLIAMFFFASVQLFFIGILGEYILSIHTHVLKRPLVIEAERINF